MPPAGYPAFLQYLQSGRVRPFKQVYVNGDEDIWPEMLGE